MNYFGVLLEIFTRENIAIFLLILCVAPILILMVYAIIRAINNRGKEEKKRQDAIQAQDIDYEQQALFYEAFGGVDNVQGTTIDMSRITVTVVDMEKVSGTQLKELGATSVLFVGNLVKASFGDRSPYVYQMIEKKS